MRTPTFVLLVSVAALASSGIAAAQDHDRYRDAVVRCESQDGRQQRCAADIRGDVRLLRQLSRSECIEGRTWGVMRDGVWVGDGCRGEFLVSGRYRGGQGTSASGILRCESKDGRSNQCAADTRRGVELVRQLSRSPCIRGRSWGSSPRGVWVTGGCRAEFRTLVDGRDARDGMPPAVTRCESVDGAPRHCPADTRGGVRIARQLSRSACIEGSTWGYDDRGIWVDGGCRADFETGGPEQSDWAWRDR